MIKVEFIFPNEIEKRNFLGWLSDGGGEYEYMELSGTKVNRFEYKDDTVELIIMPWCEECGDNMVEGHTCQ